ncbi:MAG TPA: HAMP domain-containing histidine kinase [Arcobacter sp.]|nr:HAMP domain-containing histidine kinase [Arcobacter sp.]
MTSKYKNFQISNYIIIAFLVLSTLALNYILISKFGFNQEVFIPITSGLVLVSLLLYRYLSKSLFDDFFKTDKDLDSMIKKTLHELNTPVATIDMNIKMIEKNITNEKDKRRIQRIKDSCENLLELYNKTEYELSNTIDTIEHTTFDIKEIIQKSCDKVEDIKKDITIINNTQSELITTDRYGLEIVIDNLISNGIKYNNKNGSIIIDNKNHILSIKDTGIGINTKHLLQIYDKYFQINIEHKGIGLGLSVVKDFCEKNKITIKIDSKENVGTTFLLDYHSLLSGK